MTETPPPPPLPLYDPLHCGKEWAYPDFLLVIFKRLVNGHLARKLDRVRSFQADDMLKITTTGRSKTSEYRGNCYLYFLYTSEEVYSMKKKMSNYEI